MNWSTARFIFPVVLWISLNRVCAHDKYPGFWYHKSTGIINLLAALPDTFKFFRLWGGFKEPAASMNIQRKKRKKDKEHKLHWLDAGPVVGPHLQKPAGGHTQPDASSITQQYVEDHLIPPALCEVWQQVHEEQLWTKRGKKSSIKLWSEELSIKGLHFYITTIFVLVWPLLAWGSITQSILWWVNLVLG